MPVLPRHTPSNIGAGLIVTPADMDSSIGPFAPNDTHPNTPIVVITVSVVGYLIFGLIVAVFFNGDAFSFLPQWYKRSQRSLPDKVAVVLWYLGIMIFWALIVPLYLIRMLMGWAGELRRQKKEGRTRIEGAGPAQDEETGSITQKTSVNGVAEKRVEEN